MAPGDPEKSGIKKLQTLQSGFIISNWDEHWGSGVRGQVSGPTYYSGTSLHCHTARDNLEILTDDLSVRTQGGFLALTHLAGDEQSSD